MRRQIIAGNKRKTPPEKREERSAETAGARSGTPRFIKPSGGQPLEASARSAAERAFGHDFLDVRVHAGAEASESARALQARAYTTGRDIVFAAGAYDPVSADGQHLIAHELAHVVQQSKGTASGAGTSSQSLESAADRAADRAMRGEPAKLDAAGPAPAVQRQAQHVKVSPLMARGMGSGTIDGFVTGGAALGPDQKTLVDGIADNIMSLRATDYPGCSVSVTGHTDAVGAETNNMALGQARADAVRDELVEKGVPAAIIITSSVGESQLKVPTQAAEAKNRRAEIQFEPEPRFHLAGILNSAAVPVQPPVAASVAPPPVLPPPLRPTRDVLDPETPEEAGRRIFAPIPPDPTIPQGPLPRRPLLRPVIDMIDGVLERLNVPKWARGPVKDAAVGAIVKGATGAANAAMKQADMTPEQQDAVRAAIEAAIKSQSP